MALEKWLYEELDAGKDAGPVLRTILYAWQDWHVQQGDVWGIGMMEWSRWSENIFNLVKDWHMLLHRKRSLRDEAIKLMLTRPEVQAAMDTVRERWNAVLAREGDWESLELLIARFDKDNYRLVPRDEHSFLIEFEWPEPLKARTEARVAESQRGTLVLWFPARCLQLLDGEAALAANEVEAFYEQLQQIAVQRTTSQEGVREGSVCAAICGGVAVLFILHRDWLAADPAREQWCIEQIRTILDSPPAKSEFDTPESILTFEWDSFLGELFVVLLSEDPDDALAREFAAMFACSFHYAATKLTMQRAFRCRARLGGDFVRLQNLMVLWAGVRAAIQAAHRCQTSQERWQSWRGRLISAFRDRRIAELPLKWGRVARIGQRAIHRIEKSRFPGIDNVDDASESAHEPLVVTGKRRRRGGWSTHPGLDVQLIQAAFDWISPLEENLSSAERNGRLGSLEEALSVTLSMLPWPRARPYAKRSFAYWGSWLGDSCLGRSSSAMKWLAPYRRHDRRIGWSELARSPGCVC